ncbi:DMT family protein [Elusimicrobium minutum]|uniref:DMT family protein n=1 Tax=Elusimicrobium minutum TaxID=423605 RepID=UPI00193096D9
MLLNWLIAFVEYCFQAPVNRIRAKYFTVTQLKTMQKIITLTVFIGACAVYSKEQFA